MKSKTHPPNHSFNPNPKARIKTIQSIKSEISTLQALFIEHNKTLEDLSSKIHSYKEKNIILKHQIADHYKKTLMKFLQSLNLHQSDEDPIFLEKIDKDQQAFQQLFQSPDKSQSEISALTEKFFMISYTVLNF